MEWGLRAPITPRLGGNCWALPRLGKIGAEQRKINRPKHKTSDTSDVFFQTLTFYRLPREHLKSTNMLERLNRQIKRRTRVIGIFPTRKAVCDSFEASGRNPRRLDRSSRYLNMEMLRDPSFRSQITPPQRNRGLGLHR